MRGSLALAAALSPTDAIFDGEIVHIAPDGKPAFYELMRR